MNQLSMQSRIELRKRKASGLSYLLDALYLVTDGDGAEMTVEQLMAVTHWQRRKVERVLALPVSQKPPRKSLASKIVIDSNTCIISYTKSDAKLGHKHPSIYLLPSSSAVDQFFGVYSPTFIRVRMETFTTYKADITQFLTVKEPGRHSYRQIAEAAGVHPNTVRAHEKIAGTKVVRHYAKVSMSEWNKDNLPETEADYRKHWYFQGAWLQWGTLEMPYCREGYKHLRMLGGTDDTIQVRWHEMGDHFARPDLVIEHEIDEYEKNLVVNLGEAVVAGRFSMADFMARFFPVKTPKSILPPPPVKRPEMYTRQTVAGD